MTKKIAEYKVDLKSPLGESCEEQINGIITGLKEAKKNRIENYENLKHLKICMYYDNKA